jgi:anaerobic magnesium-protoporphyrin IX monomethyl ester cyclase
VLCGTYSVDRNSTMLVPYPAADPRGERRPFVCGAPMLSILVCHSYFLNLDEKQVARAKPYPPLATLQAVNVLRLAGHQVDFFDAMLAEGSDDYQERLRAQRPQVVLFYEDNFNFLSKMCLATMRQAAFRMIGSARVGGARVVVAGPDVTDAPASYLRAGADFALIGEGLAALLELLPRIELGALRLAEDIAQGLTGIACLRAGTVEVVRDSRPAALVAQIGAAAWDLVDVERYRKVWIQAHGYFSLNLAASRGCSFRCTWCAKPIWGNQYLQRDPDEVAAEISFLKNSFAPDHIWFADDIFGFRTEWVRRFADSVRKADALVPFTIQTRADLISEPMAAALRDAGCREAWLGAESGSQRVLDSMNKGTSIAEILTARERLQAAGIRVGFFIQLGYLGEQLADLAATRELISAAQPDEIGVSVAYPLPGTRFYDLVKAQLGAKTHWRESNDLDMMFSGTYTSEFYRCVRNLLHEEVDLIGEGGMQGREGVERLEQQWRALFANEHAYRTSLAEVG